MSATPRLRDVFRDATPYRRPALPPGIELWLDGNEGPTLDAAWLANGTTPNAAAVRRYPDAGPLTERLAVRHGLDAERVLVTAGADEAIDRCCRITLDPSDEAVVPTPCFAMVPKAIRLTGARMVCVPWSGRPVTADEVLAVVSERTRVVFLTTPDNPTGAVLPGETLLTIARALPEVVIVVDLVYVAFADEDPTDELLALPNVLVLRSFSKAWGVAGLRLGYVLGPAPLVAAVCAAGPPYSVAAPTLALGERLLDEPPAEGPAYVAAARKERDALVDVLRELGAAPLPSGGNFVFARSPRASWMVAALAGLGIAVRGFPGDPELGDAVRITCPGDDDAFARLVSALRAALAPEALLFDMDGVLAEVSRSYREAILATAHAFGADVTAADVAEAKRRGDANDDWRLTWQLLEDRGKTVSLSDVTTRFEAFYQGENGVPGLRERESLLVPVERLRAWASRRPLAVVTGRPRADAERFLERFGLRDVFRCVVAREDAPLKPDPAPVRAALAALGVEAAWMIGDTVDDLRAARAAGVVSVGVLTESCGDEDRRRLAAAGAAAVLEATVDLEEMLP